MRQKDLNFLDRNEFNYSPSKEVVEALKNFDVTKYIDRKEARKMDLYTQYAIAVAKEAVADSGLCLLYTSRCV